jgi:phenylpropionate dioxygenase-like ring-hydroxylating dioxygenase large terminal subunit
MLSAEKNRLLTQTDRGTPMGELFRRYWLPALHADELPRPDGVPVRVRLLGEDLVAFRDSNGTIGLLDEYCPHRSASLFLGRNEEGGLRCIYHGWKFDASGRCSEIPSEPAESTYRDRVRAKNYPVVEKGGIVWAFLGPHDAVPPVPDFEFTLVPPAHRITTKAIQPTNYLQALEGTLDSGHLSFLHQGNFGRQYVKSNEGPSFLAAAAAPEFHIIDTPSGMTVGSKRALPDGRAYWRMTQFVLPAIAFIPPNGGNARNVLAFVPIDDTNTLSWAISWQPVRPIDDDERDRIRSGIGVHPKLIPGTFRPEVNPENGYLQNRELQASGASYTGIPGIAAQDLAVQQSAGPIVDRTKEHLASSDRAIIETRRLLEEGARAVGAGHVPKGLTDQRHRVRSAAFVANPGESWEGNVDRLRFEPERDFSPERALVAP